MSVFFCAEEKVKKKNPTADTLLFYDHPAKTAKRLFDLQTIKNHDGHKAILPVVGDACALSGLCLLEFNMCYSWFLLSHVLFELIC